MPLKLKVASSDSSNSAGFVGVLADGKNTHTHEDGLKNNPFFEIQPLFFQNKMLKIKTHLLVSFTLSVLWFLVVWEVSKTTFFYFWFFGKYERLPIIHHLRNFYLDLVRAQKKTSTLSGNPFSQEIQQYESLHVHQWAPLCRRVGKRCSIVGDARINRITIWSKRESIGQHICWRVFIMTWYSNKPTNFDQLSFLQKERKADCKSPWIYSI